jgi:hypothetical protein
MTLQNLVKLVQASGKALLVPAAAAFRRPT